MFNILGWWMRDQLGQGFFFRRRRWRWRQRRGRRRFRLGRCGWTFNGGRGSGRRSSRRLRFGSGRRGGRSLDPIVGWCLPSCTGRRDRRLVRRLGILAIRRTGGRLLLGHGRLGLFGLRRGRLLSCRRNGAEDQDNRRSQADGNRSENGAGVCGCHMGPIQCESLARVKRVSGR